MYHIPSGERVPLLSVTRLLQSPPVGASPGVRLHFDGMGKD